MDYNFERIKLEVVETLLSELDKILDEEDKNWSDDVKTDFKPKKDIFAKGTGKEIANYLMRNSKDQAQAMQRLNFYINRGGKDVPNKPSLNRAKQILMKKKNSESLAESVDNFPDKLILYHAHEWKFGEQIETDFALYDDNRCIYLTDDFEFAQEFGDIVDRCELAVHNLYIMDPYLLDENGEPFMYEDDDDTPLMIGEIQDSEDALCYLEDNGYDTVVEKGSLNFVVCLNPDNVTILEKDILNNQ